MLNFTYILKEPKDGAFGTLQDDGTWNGMVRLLQGEAYVPVLQTEVLERLLLKIHQNDTNII